MLFNSYIFIFVFLPITILGFFFIPKIRNFRFSFLWLTLASLFFYGYWNFKYLLILLTSILVNYVFGQLLDRNKQKSARAKGLLVCGTIFNLGLLGYYKYADFVVNSINSSFKTNLPNLNIVLPLAISFYTFTQIAYLVDVYKGETKEQKYDLISYTLFVSFFPQLIAGPILRHNELIPQFHKLSIFRFSEENFAKGVTLFILGLSKKVIIADNLSPWVTLVFNNADSVSFLEAWIGAISYTFQLYFDFSGYSDMAIGLGWMFNIQLPINFNSPYKATSIIDFWRRWHITLSNFLRDYLYIPLGGNRLGEFRRYINLIITMLLGGLWHGAGWTFVIWGGMHGLLLVINQIWRRLGISIPKFLAWILTFHGILLSWVLFRAKTFADAFHIIKVMTGIEGILLPHTFKIFLNWVPIGGIFKGWQELLYLPPIGGKNSLIILFIVFVSTLTLPNTQELMSRFKPNLRTAILTSMLATTCFLFFNRISEFLYFQF
ncbi:MBOAT family O-acyltransferase [Oxynema aestuarii]|uniref:MBOAT family protein n=1 Tax=Oxynema aestuarii AP17 TaxID=2064643 RepID=A0A6H1U3L3_9CYAN|nr:MBOAT family protein [Oxynema aestuarii]QIZ72967.1 MBOAT family protein [Oxynema aestuarii AP17]